MKSIALSLSVFFLISVECPAQLMPKNPNMIDEFGRKTGTWTILYDSNWNIIANVDSAAFYRVITYKDGKPVGKVIDFYRGGQVQMEGELLTDDPQVLNGEVRYYAETGEVQNLEFYSDGIFNYDKSIDLLVKHIKSDIQIYPSIYIELGRLYTHKGEYNDAQVVLNDGIKFIKERYGVSNELYIEVLTRLGSLYNNMGYYPRAEELNLEALELEEKLYGKNRPEYAHRLLGLATTYRLQGLYSKASTFAKKALKYQIMNLGESHSFTPPYYNELALVYAAQKEFKKADSSLRKALQISRNSQEAGRQQYNTLLNNLAFIHANRKLYKKADSLYNLSLKLVEEIFGIDHIDYAISLNNLAQVYQALGKYTKADSTYQLALPIYDKVLSDRNYFYTKTRFNQAQLHHLQNKWSRSRSTFLDLKDYYLNYVADLFSNLSERDRREFYSIVKEFFETFQGYCIDNHERYPDLISGLFDLQLATKSILLNTSNKIKSAILKSNDRVLIDLYDEVQNLKQQLGRNFDNPSVSKSKSAYFDSLESVLIQKDKQLSRFASYYEREKRKYTWRDIQSFLERDEAAIEIIRYRKRDYKERQFTDSIRYAALMVSSKTKNHPQLILLNDGESIEQRFLNYYRNGIRFKTDDIESYNNFWAPIKEHLKGIRKV